MQLLLFCAITLTFSSCYLPQDYDTNITFAADGSYKFSYSGKLISILHRAAIKDGKKLSAADDKKFENAALQMKKDKDVKSASYSGDGVYKLSYETNVAVGKSYVFLDKTTKLFEVINKKDGSIEIRSSKINAEEIKRLQKLDLNPSGVVSLDLPKNAVITKHNADSTPTMGFGSYTWKMNDFSKNVSVIFKISKQ